MLLKRININDYDNFYDLLTMKKVYKYVSDGKKWSQEKVRKLIKYSIKEYNLDSFKRKYFYYKIEDNNKFIGFIGFGYNFLKNNKYYLTIAIHPKFQRKGYFKKALEELIIKFKKHKPEEKYLYSIVYSKNKRMTNISNKKFKISGEYNINNNKVNEYSIKV